MIRELIADFNEYASLDDINNINEIEPKFLGVIFTMVQFRNKRPISVQRPFMEQTRRLGLPVFEAYMRENKTLFGEAPMYGVPVVLNYYSNATYSNIVSELEELSGSLKGH
jgi:chromosome partitioning protein